MKTILPCQATARVDSRLPPGHDPELAPGLIRDHLAEPGCQALEMRKVSGYRPSKTPVAAPLVQKGIEVYRKHARTPTMRIAILALAVHAALVGGATPLRAQPAPLDTSSLATGPYASMQMLFEKTIFQVDVLTLDIRFSPELAQRLESLAEGREYSDGFADSIASAALDARDARVAVEFQRDVSLDQFVDGVRENLEKARDAGIIASETYEMISENFPRWFGFLQERRIHDGDRILYRIRGDTLRTVFRGADGQLLLDQTDTGAERRLAVLGSYFAPGSNFREDLIRSLFERD